MPVALDDHTGTIGWATASPNRRLRLTTAFLALVVATLALVVAEAQPGRAQEPADPAAATPPAGDGTDADGQAADDGTGAATRVPAVDRLEVTVRGGQSRLGPPEVIGDIDGDGIADLAVGAYSDDLAGENTGAVYLLLMNADGTVRSQQRVSAAAGGFEGELLAGSGFGFRVAALGDVDGDGTPDMAVSAYRSGRTGPETGEIWVLFLAPDATVRSWQVITDGYAGFDVDLGDGDQLGVDLAAIGDLDANGVTDLAVGAWRSDADAADPDGDQGALYLITLDRDGRTLATSELSPATGWPAPLGIGDGLGVSVDAVGDLDGNGVTDLAVGAAGTDADTGAVHVALMNADATVASVSVITPGGGVVPALIPGDRFGATVAGLGDVDGDGRAELAVGAFGVEEFRGAVWVLGLGADGAATSALRLPSPELDPDDLFGHTIAAVRSGSSPATALLVGAPGDDTAGIDAGAVYVVPLGAAPDPERGPEGDLDGDGVPNGVEGRVDTDGDGQPDRRDRDSDDDGIGDRGELDPDTGLDTDTDGDGLVDRLDPDDDNDGIPTAIEGRRDPDVDQIPNNEDLDSDGDGIVDAIEGTGDTDGDGIPDFLDTDADDDGVADDEESPGDTDGDGAPDAVDTDADGDGIGDAIEGTVDTDGDGAPDVVDTDADGDGIGDADEGTVDTDGDGAPDVVDTDADGDGIGDADEGTVDTDGDGTPDRLDTDADGDGIGDADEGTVDTDGDGTPDRLDTDADGDGIPDAVEGSVDTDGDGTPDRLDADADNDGRSDAEEGVDDVDGDGIPDFRDERVVRAAVGVQVLAPEQLVAGQPNELLLSVVNAGPDAASMTEATMRIPVGVRIDPAQLPEDCWISNDQVVCRFGALDVDETAVRSITAELDPGVDDVEFAASVRAPEGRAESSSGSLGVIGRAADELGTPFGALIAVVVVALVTGIAILVLTRQRDTAEMS